MAMFKSRCSGALLRGLGSRVFRSVTSNVNSRKSNWESPQATVLSNFHRPMSTSEVKNWTPMEEIRNLRVVTAVKTPYLPNGRFDLETYDKLVNMQIENGIEGILVAGTTGEGYLMSRDEKTMLTAHTVNSFGDKVKVIGNAGSNRTSEAITLTEQGFAVGMDAALHINPYYGHTTNEGLLAHYNSVLSVGPIIIYNIPSRTGQDVPPGVVEILAKNPNLVGVKECTGLDRIKKYTNEGLAVWTGFDKDSYEARWDCGAVGVQTVIGNLIPGLMRQLMYDGKNPKLNSKLKPLLDFAALVPAPIAINTGLAQLGVIKPVFRLQQVPLPLERRKEFVKLVEELGREHFVGDKDVQVLDDDEFIFVDRY